MGKFKYEHGNNSIGNLKYMDPKILHVVHKKKIRNDLSVFTQLCLSFYYRRPSKPLPGYSARPPRF